MKWRCLKMERTHKATVLKEVRNKGVWFGYVAPSNVNSFHITGGWHLGHLITISQGRDGEYYVVSWHNEYEKLSTWLNAFAVYSCVAELGKRPVFWVK